MMGKSFFMIASMLTAHLALQIFAFPSLQRSIQDPPDTGVSNVTYPLPEHLIYNFPAETWIENLAVRSNGQIIATEELRPRVYQVDPFGTREPILLHEFHETASVLGIVETSPDVFHICTGNFSSAKLQGFGEAYVFRVDMRDFHPDRPSSAKVAKVAALPQAKALDGLTFLRGEADLLLVSDFILGVIFSVDIHTGDSRIVINNTYTQSAGFAVNGLKIYDNFLYFTNSQKQTLVKVPINAKGEAVGNYTVLAQGGFTPDDFALDAHGDAYVASFTPGKNGLAFVPREGGLATYIAGIAGPTSAAFGRTPADRNVLYVSTTGGDYEYSSGKPVTVSGKIVKIDVGRYGPRK